MKQTFLIILLLVGVKSVNAQDPSFSQFFSSPLNINPALTANINADWRLISNLRDQWLNPASPYVTGTISFDRKILQNKSKYTEEDDILGIGGMLMFDYAFSGIVKSTYGSANLSYNIKLAGEGERAHRFGAGFGAIYGYRNVDFSRVDFEEQFTGFGFNTNLPTGEAALSQTKPYISVSAGLVYTYRSANSNFDAGVAGFHLNKPKQTFLEDENQVLAMRQVAHANFETFINARLILNTNAVYQFQQQASYFSVGGALGYFMGDYETLVNAGLWYWSDNALVPYFGFAYKALQVGISYDITTSKLNEATRKPSTWELSLILRGSSSPPDIIPCPWK